MKAFLFFLVLPVALSKCDHCGLLDPFVVSGLKYRGVCYVMLNADAVALARRRILNDTAGPNPDIVLKKSHAVELCNAMKYLMQAYEGPVPPLAYKIMHKVAGPDMKITLARPTDDVSSSYIIRTFMPMKTQVFLDIDVDNLPNVREPRPTAIATHLNSGKCGYLIHEPLSPDGTTTTGLHHVDCEKPYVAGRESEGSKAVVCQFPFPHPCGLERYNVCRPHEGDCLLFSGVRIVKQAHRLSWPCPRPVETKGPCPREKYNQCFRDCMWTNWMVAGPCSPCRKVTFYRQIAQQAVAGKPCNLMDATKDDKCPPCRGSKLQYSLKALVIYIILSVTIRFAFARNTCSLTNL